MNGNTFDMGKRKAGEEYLLMLPLETPEDVTVKDASTNCVCVNFLDYPQSLQKGKTASAIVYFALDKPAKFNFELKLKTDKNDLMYKLTGETFVDGVLKKARPATADSINPVFIQRRLIDAEEQLYMETGKAMGSQSAMKFIDIRPASEFNACRINESVNMPFSLLKANSFFRNECIVLVDKGFYSEKMENACRELRKLGFNKAYILCGGLNAWIRKGGTVSGTKRTAEEIKMLTPAELLMARSFRELLFVNCDSERPDVSIFPKLTPLESVSGQISRKSQIVLISSGSPEKVLQLPEKYNIDVPVFVLAGGAVAYRDFLVTSSLMLNGGKVAQKSKLKNCGGCP